MARSRRGRFGIIVWEGTVEKARLLHSRDSLWLGELLRYFGISKRLAEFSNRTVFELRHPDHGDVRWCEQQAERLRSFGFDAVAAPMWDGHDTTFFTGR